MAAKKEPMVKIEYVGVKEWAIDNVCDTATAWNGKGDVQEVTESVAEKLLTHPTEFAIYDPKAKAAAKKAAESVLASATAQSEADAAKAVAAKQAFDNAVAAYQQAVADGKDEQVADLEAAASQAEAISIEADEVAASSAAALVVATEALAKL